MHTILGVNGTIGPYLAKALHEKNIKVRGVSRRAAKGDFDHVRADVLNLPELIAAVDGSDVVYLVVGLAYDRKVWQRDWPIVMTNTIEACRATGAKLVFMDNVYAYGRFKGPITEDLPYHPCSEKGKVRKQIAEQLMDAVEQKNIRACIARGADFFGPHADLSVITSTVIERHAKGKKAQWMGDAGKLHNFTFSKDMGPALAILGTEKKADNEVWHLPTSREPWTGADWVRASAEAFGAPQGFQEAGPMIMKLMGLFMPIMREVGEMSYQFTDDYVFSSEKFEKAFGMQPTPNAVGLADTVKWYGEK